MFDLGPYSQFIIAAYSISLVTLLGLTIWVHASEKNYEKKLSYFQKEAEDET